MSEGEITLHRTGEATCKSALQVRAEESTVQGHLTVQTEGLRPASRTITVTERPLSNSNGRISHDAIKRIARDCYVEFSRQRKQQDAIAADVADMEELKAIKAEMSKPRKGSGR